MKTCKVVALAMCGGVLTAFEYDFDACLVRECTADLNTGDVNVFEWHGTIDELLKKLKEYELHGWDVAVDKSKLGLELVVVLKKGDNVIKLWRDTSFFNFYIEENGEFRPFITDAKTLPRRTVDVNDWLHFKIDTQGYEVVYLPFAEKTDEDLMPLYIERLNYMEDRPFDFTRIYSLVYLESYILDKKFMDWHYRYLEKKFENRGRA